MILKFLFVIFFYSFLYFCVYFFIISYIQESEKEMAELPEYKTAQEVLKDASVQITS